MPLIDEKLAVRANVKYRQSDGYIRNINPIGGGTWNQDGVMLFSSAGLIYRVSAAGGQPTAITALDQSKQESDHIGPSFLP